MSKLRFALFFQIQTVILKVFILSLTLIGLGFSDMLRFGGAGGGEVSISPQCIFIVSGPITMTFCTGIYHQSVSSNMKKNLHKINDFIDNDVILLGPVSFVQNTQKKVKYTVYSLITPSSPYHIIWH